MAKVDFLKDMTVQKQEPMKDGQLKHYHGPNGSGPTKQIVNRGEKKTY